MRAKVVLLARKRDESGDYPFLPVAIKRGKPVPVEGATQYYLRFSDHGKRKVEPVGPDLNQAFVAYLNRELNHSRIQNGLIPIEGPAGLLQDFKNHSTNRARIADAVEKFVKELEESVRIGEKSASTLVAYRNAVRRFQENCGVEFFDEITADVLKSYKTWLYDNIDKRSRGERQITVANNFRYLGIFLRENGIKISKNQNPEPGD